MITKSLGILASVMVLALTPALRAGSKVPPPLLDGIKTIEDEEQRLDVQAAVVSFAEAPQLEGFFEKCYGCAIFPTIGKGGLGIGGARGTGWVFEKNTLTGTVTMTQVTFGFQAGGQAFSQVIFFEDARAYRTFTSGNFEFGAQASAVAIKEGANASASTVGGTAAGAGDSQAKQSYSDGMAVFTKAKGGLMYEASVGGQKFKFRPIKE